MANKSIEIYISENNFFEYNLNPLGFAVRLTIKILISSMHKTLENNKIMLL